MPTSEYFRSPSQLLEELGIREPADLDIEAIAYHCGATVIYRPLAGCAARIVGTANRAIITVDSESPRGRQRFSAGHELGHWMHDRGRVSFACEEEQLTREWCSESRETRANRYAAELLLPLPLFRPMTQCLKLIDLDVARDLARKFEMSLTATAIRLVEHGPLPSMLVCCSACGRDWFVRASGVSEKLWPRAKPLQGTYAFDLLRAGGQREARGSVRADAWFDHWIAPNYFIHEHSISRNYGQVLSLIWWKDEQMLIDLEEHEEREAARRSDSRGWE